MESKITKVEIDGEEINLTKGKFGFNYRVVHPARDSEGKINYWNLFFGGKSNAIRLAVYLLIVLLLYLGITELISNYQYIAANPCEFCVDCFTKRIEGINYT